MKLKDNASIISFFFRIPLTEKENNKMVPIGNWSVLSSKCSKFNTYVTHKNTHKIHRKSQD